MIRVVHGPLGMAALKEPHCLQRIEAVVLAGSRWASEPDRPVRLAAALPVGTTLSAGWTNGSAMLEVGVEERESGIALEPAANAARSGPDSHSDHPLTPIWPVQNKPLSMNESMFRSA